MKIRKEKSRAKYLIQTGFNDDIAHGWTADPEQAAISGELRDAVDLELAKLSPELRATVVMRDVQGLSTEESAETLGLSIPAFKSRLHRARILVRKGLEVYLASEK